MESMKKDPNQTPLSTAFNKTEYAVFYIIGSLHSEGSVFPD